MSYLDDAHDALDDRRQQRIRQLGARGARCSVPGRTEGDPLALTGVHPDVRCYECQARERGRPAVEGHHVSGRRNDATDIAAVAGNEHRVLSELQRNWPQATLRNPDQSVLLRAAAALRGWLDLLVLIIDRSLGWIPEFLEALDAALTRVYGPDWPALLGLSEPS